ncbi:MAG: hypothetical protein H6897_06425 [Rhodobacteraceae bacterium]|mgnify:CR=1 FL=1|jgi:hypothetical protein|uniref:hypothetical protein n=1 Tax=Albidovulum sp. TaxID=1872424 RepID=UPI001E127C3A|nr:hypothetical protein [uncultured Defluviimonas sp.]MCB2124981.1 hypothetical protein [Paracoccaceae bacterium]MCC0069549.1 hypothetical protein [Paracoccaceae bacterium]
MTTDTTPARHSVEPGNVVEEAAFDTVRARAAATGGFARDLPAHLLAFLPAPGPAPRDARRLVVTYDNLASARETETRAPWGHEFLAAQGWDVLGVMIKRKDWFRHAALIEAMEALAAERFFAGFGAVSAFGSSMGGFGALTFAGHYPGATILAFAPQSTLDPVHAPFETRYRYARRTLPWTGGYADAAEAAGAAGRLYLAFDPHQAEDAAHAARLAGPNTIPLRMPHLGHKLPPALLRMGQLKPLAHAALEGTLDIPAFHRMMRARFASPSYVEALLARAGDRGHHRLALRAADRLMAERPHWKIGRQRRGLRAGLAAEADLASD